MGSSFLLTLLICCLLKCKLPNFPTKMQCWQHFLKSSSFRFILLGFIRTIDYNPTGIYLFKVNNRNTRTMCEICSWLTIKTPERRQWRVLVPLLLTLHRCHLLFWCFYNWLWRSKCQLGSCYRSLSIRPENIRKPDM